MSWYFAGFHSYYEELINKTRENKLTADDFQGTNITLTNPGGLGTVASVPRLMTGQGTIVATGNPEQLAQVDASYTGQYLRPVLAEGRSHAYAAGR